MQYGLRSPRAAADPAKAPPPPEVHRFEDKATGVTAVVSVPADLKEGVKLTLSDKRVSVDLEIAAAPGELEKEVEALVRSGVPRAQATAAVIAEKPWLYTGGHNV